VIEETSVSEEMRSAHTPQKRDYPRYVLITPARNEDKHIRKTIESVASQSVLPDRWIIISDGSTDKTEEIVREFESVYPFITLHCTKADGERNFGSKVRAIKSGIELLGGEEYEYLGFLDADISFDFNYFAKIIGEFEKDQTLGLAGGIILDKTADGFIEQVASLSSVAGAVQMFRRRCYEEIGGYRPVKSGGIDTVAEVMARMHGWTTRSFPELKILHYRPTGSQGARNLLSVRFKQGKSDFCLGYHPVFYLCMLLKRFREKPYVIGSLCRLIGYAYARITVGKFSVPDEFVKFLRQEQMRRLVPLNVLRG
jgi:poly-beta-1,6-N-acetyl-D-glucosamine synthase